MDSLTYKLNFLHPELGEIWQSEEIAADASASTFKSGISGYYSDYYGSSISVTLEYYNDVDELIETLDEFVVKYKYTINLLRRISGYTTSSITFLAVDTAATAAIEYPETVQLSAAPLAGKYIITCTDPQGVEWPTAEIPYNNWDASVQ